MVSGDGEGFYTGPLLFSLSALGEGGLSRLHFAGGPHNPGSRLFQDLFKIMFFCAFALGAGLRRQAQAA